jgi:MFS family permease
LHAPVSSCAEIMRAESIPAMQSSWKRNFYVIWIAQLRAVAGFGTSSPIISFYVQELGLSDPDAIKLWAGLIQTAGSLSVALFGPLWGRLGGKVRQAAYVPPRAPRRRNIRFLRLPRDVLLHLLPVARRGVHRASIRQGGLRQEKADGISVAALVFISVGRKVSRVYPISR